MSLLGLQDLKYVTSNVVCRLYSDTYRCTGLYGLCHLTCHFLLHSPFCLPFCNFPSAPPSIQLYSATSCLVAPTPFLLLNVCVMCDIYRLTHMAHPLAETIKNVDAHN